MGVYLNSKSAYTLYKNESKKPYFIDKSLMLGELFPLAEEGSNYICITRPRRFGKTVMANMIASFFSRAHPSGGVFGSLKIAGHKEYKTYQNQYSVIHIPFNDTAGHCHTYTDYIRQIEQQLIRDLKAAYPKVELYGESVISALAQIYAENDTARFIFVLDEWDFIFHQTFITEDDKKDYLSFLRSLLKDRPYVILAYMTGILPIAKYSSGSELNMFLEFTMAEEERFSEYFGFTQEETDILLKRYHQNTAKPWRVTKWGLKHWYDGYHTKSEKRLYNPRSVTAALSNNNLGNYWTSSGPYDEIFYYVKNNIGAVREDLTQMMAGTAIPVKIQEYAAVSMHLKTKEEIFSAMVVYGFLSYKNGKVSIPNRELMDKFADMIRREPSLGYVYRLARESERMLQATLVGDTDTMTEILEYVHNTESPLLDYNHETELTAIVNLAYLAARDTYRVEREERAGTGYADFLFYPEVDKSADCIILELKIDHTPDEAIRQIEARNYALRFRGKTAEKPVFTGKIRAVGISYNRKTKRHSCKVKIL